MEIQVVKAAPSDHQALRNLMQLYAYDFSEILPADVEATGLFTAPSLDVYWTDAWRFPFLIRASKQIAGFALVHQRSRLSGADDVWDMAEFFVLRRYRRLGVGMAAAEKIFTCHPGAWEVRQHDANTSATAFWRRAIATATGGGFTEEHLDDARWCGPVQRFNNLGVRPD
jgi:predicted acetyltransferase